MDNEYIFPFSEDQTTGISIADYVVIHTKETDYKVQSSGLIDDLVNKQIRREIATAAMQGLCANPNLISLSADRIAEEAVKFADALLDELY